MSHNNMAQVSRCTEAFLLTRQWQDTPGGIKLDFWFSSADGPVHVRIENQRAVFFIRQADITRVSKALAQIDGISIKKLQLHNFTHETIAGVYCSSQQGLYRSREQLQNLVIPHYEADIRPVERYLSERFLTGPVDIHTGQSNAQVIINPSLRPGHYRPQLKLMSVDIETAYDSQALYSISLLCEHWKMTLMRTNQADTGHSDAIEYHASEKELLQRFIELVQEQDPDVLIGWNVINFDLRFLQDKADHLNIALVIGRDGMLPIWRKAQTERSHFFLLIPGRVVLDGIDTLKSATWNFESFSLEFVANHFLDRGKLIQSQATSNGKINHDPLYKAKQIKRLFHEDKAALAAYNLEDCQLVWDIFKAADLVEFAIERARLTGLEMDRTGGSVAAFDNLYLPRLHRKGYVASPASDLEETVSAPGGYVMNSKPGLFDSVLVLDYKSLYPSIIRTFKVDPYARIRAQQLSDHDCVPGYKGIKFARQDSILPAIIESLWQARDKAKESQNKALSQAIKIIMNSFYGVLGTPGCRVHDARLTSSITMRGHDLIKKTVLLIEQEGYEVIYGDTDSVFVSLGAAKSTGQADEIGRKLVKKINRYWHSNLAQQYQIESFLEMEYETHFRRFFMPTVRGSDKGSKKRYAGVIANDAAAGAMGPIVFKGLETVRTDWTLLAREVQQEVYHRVFNDTDYQMYLRTMVQHLRAGELDDKLVYRKRLRQKLSDYQKNRPPHAQAALKAQAYARESGDQSERYKNGGWIEYVITTGGPEPLAYNVQTLDYEHYIDKQIAPAVDPILMVLGSSLEKVIQKQYELF